MAKTANRFGGGAQTNVNGLRFEQTTSLDIALANAGYRVVEHNVYNGTSKIGLSVPKYSFYKYFLIPNGIDFKKYNSKRWLPDECYVNLQNNTVYIVEKKFQKRSGSVDEKLTNCDFKRKEYEKLCTPIGFEVEYLYVFNDWFLQNKYRDHLEYIEMVGCHYFYNEIPLTNLGL